MLDTELNYAPHTEEDTSFVQFWNTVLASKFIRFKHILVGGLPRHSEAIFPTLPVREGDRVLDVGCGFGDTAIKLARLVGPTGAVVGIDCCDAFLEIAQREVEASGLGNVRLMRGDAEIALPTNAFDFVFARFGTMFFANPVAGLRNMRRALRPGGRMVHIVWRNRADNPWLSMAKDVGRSAGSTGAALSQNEIGLGLKDALKVASQRVVGRVGKLDGYNGDPAIRIPLPDALQKIEGPLRAVGASGMLDDLRVKMNRAAEQAAPKALNIFVDAATRMGSVLICPDVQRNEVRNVVNDRCDARSPERSDNWTSNKGYENKRASIFHLAEPYKTAER